MPGVDWVTEQRGLSVRRCAGAGAGSCLCPVRRHGGEAQLCIASSSQQQFSHRASFVPTVATGACTGRGETGNPGSVLSPAAGEDNVFITAESHGHTTPPGHYDSSHQCWPPPPLPASWLAVVTLVSKVGAAAARSHIPIHPYSKLCVDTVSILQACRLSP